MSEWIPARPEGPHPTVEELFGAWRAPERPEARLVLRHAAGCAACSEELLRLESFDRPEPVVDVDRAWARFAARIEREAPGASAEPSGRMLPFPAGGSPPQIHKRKAGRLGRVLALAASTLLAAGLAYFWVSQRPLDGGDALRGQGGPGLAAEAFEPRGTLDAPPRRFVFPAQESTPLAVSLRSSDGTYQWTSPSTTSGTVELSEAERARLLPGVDYYWTVLGGAEVPAKRFRIGTR